MTQVEMFFTLNEILCKSVNTNGEIHDFVLAKLREMPRTLKIYSVLTADYNEEKKFTKYSDALAEWNSNPNWKRLEYFNPCGDVTTLKTRD